MACDDDKTKRRTLIVRLAWFVAGGAAIAVGTLIPATAAALVPAGTLAIGIGLKTPGVKK